MDIPVISGFFGALTANRVLLNRTSAGVCIEESKEQNRLEVDFNKSIHVMQCVKCKTPSAKHQSVLNHAKKACPGTDQG